MAHTTQFTEVGWRYLPAGSGSYKLKFGGTIVSYISPNKTDFTIVIETMSHKISECVRPHTPAYNTSTQNITLRLNGVLSSSVNSLRYWHSKISPNDKDCRMMIKQPDIAVRSGLVSLFNIPANTLITLTTSKTGQKGTPKSKIPDGKLFPLTYKDDFEPKNGLRFGNEPTYLTPQTGTFQLSKFQNRTVLVQTMYAPPVEFCGDTPYKKVHFPSKVAPVAVMPFNPWAYPGHSYSVSVDIALASHPNTTMNSGVFLALYMNQGGCHVPLSKGLFFVFNNTNDGLGGVYNRFNFTPENLITGFEFPLIFKVNQFIKITVGVKNSQIDHVSMNNVAVVEGIEILKSYTGGLLGLGCTGFHKCMYDNLDIGPYYNKDIKNT